MEKLTFKTINCIAFEYQYTSTSFRRPFVIHNTQMIVEMKSVQHTYCAGQLFPYSSDIHNES